MCIQVFDKGVKIFQLGGAGSGSGGVVDITNYNFLWELDLDGEVFKGILLVTRWDGYYFEFNIFVNIEAHSPPPSLRSCFIYKWMETRNEKDVWVRYLPNFLHSNCSDIDSGTGEARN
jgi:hypothetical protein